jgi:hypothetical protein
MIPVSPCHHLFGSKKSTEHKAFAYNDHQLSDLQELKYEVRHENLIFHLQDLLRVTEQPLHSHFHTVIINLAECFLSPYLREPHLHNHGNGRLLQRLPNGAQSHTTNPWHPASIYIPHTYIDMCNDGCNRIDKSHITVHEPWVISDGQYNFQQLNMEFTDERLRILHQSIQPT